MKRLDTTVRHLKEMAAASNAIHRPDNFHIEIAVGLTIDGRPHWATGRTKSYDVIGALLPTRDGRRVGNACVVGRGHIMNVHYMKVLTDAGTLLRLTKQELKELFHPPEWKMNPTTCPGMRPKFNERH